MPSNRGAVHMYVGYFPAKTREAFFRTNITLRAETTCVRSVAMVGRNAATEPENVLLQLAHWLDQLPPGWPVRR